MNNDPPSPHRPSGLNLLRIARQTFEAALLPALSGEDRYTALMVGHALAICEREWSGSTEGLVDQTAATPGLAEPSDPMSANDEPSEAVWAALMQEVRARLVVDKGDAPGAAT